MSTAAHPAATARCSVPAHPARLGLNKAQWQILLRPQTLPTVVRITLIVALSLVCAALAHRVSSLWAKLGLWALTGFFVNGLIQLAHETWHHNLFAGRRANQMMGHVLGFLVGISHEAMRHDHLLHHKWNRTPRDPDAYNAGTPSVLTWLRFYSVAFGGIPLAIPFFNFLYPLTFMDAPSRARHFRHLLAYSLVHVAVWSLIVAQGALDSALHLWIIPLLCASPWNGLKSIADHHANLWEGDRYHTATTVRSNVFVRYFWSGLNHHLDHHLYPRVPGPNLPQLHALLSPYLAAQQSPVFERYATVFLAALRAGPTYTKQDHFLRATAPVANERGGR